jgi:hypothetical protein
VSVQSELETEVTHQALLKVTLAQSAVVAPERVIPVPAIKLSVDALPAIFTQPTRYSCP